jgi:hypothetical protein
VTVLDLIVVLLASLWLSVTVANDSLVGPMGILSYLRYKAGLRYDDFSNPITEPGSFAEMLSCPYCNSFWAGLAIVILYLALDLAGVSPALVLAPLAAGGFIILVQELKGSQ